MTPPRVLTVAGSDPSGGAGVQADLKTFAAFGCYGMSVLTALTAQNTVGVRSVHAPPAAFVAAQLNAVLEDCPPAATKTGMLYSAEIVHTVAVALSGGAGGALVVDPVMVATSGDRLLRPDAEAALVERLLPLAALVTPNAAEAEVLAGRPVRSEADARLAADAILALGPRAVLVKGGHMDSATDARDVLVTADGESAVFVRERVGVTAPHGAGCTLSAAVAAALARGATLHTAVEAAKDFVHRGLAAAFAVGAGGVPVNHLVEAPDLP